MGRQHTLPEGIQGGFHSGGRVLKDDGSLALEKGGTVFRKKELSV